MTKRKIKSRSPKRRKIQSRSPKRRKIESRPHDSGFLSDMYNYVKGLFVLDHRRVTPSISDKSKPESSSKKTEQNDLITSSSITSSIPSSEFP
jgi:hypothetical protein